MSQTSPAPTPPAAGPAPAPPDDAMAASDLRSLALVAYVLFLIAGLNGLSLLVGVVIAYVKRRDAAGTVWESHFNNLIMVFWVMVGGAILGLLTWPIALGAFLVAWPEFWPPALTLPFAFGFVVFPLLVVWYLYRVIRGLIRAAEERPF